MLVYIYNECFVALRFQIVVYECFGFPRVWGSVIDVPRFSSRPVVFLLEATDDDNDTTQALMELYCP